MVKGFKDSKGRFRPTGNKSSGVSSKQIKNKKSVGYGNHDHTSVSENDFRNKRSNSEVMEELHENSSNKPLTPEQIEKNIVILTRGTNPVYIEMVKRFPNSSVGSDVMIWAKSGNLGSHGSFGDALKEGDITNAMYRADSDNLVNLDDIGIDDLLSDLTDHPDDTSPRQDFRDRVRWARENTGRLDTR